MGRFQTHKKMGNMHGKQEIQHINYTKLHLYVSAFVHPGWLVLCIIYNPVVYTLPETNMSPENGWLEDDPFLLRSGLFSGALAVSFRECIPNYGN